LKSTISESLSRRLGARGQKRWPQLCRRCQGSDRSRDLRPDRWVHRRVHPRVGGCVVFPEDYLRHAYEHVRSASGVCIADEVQTGFGRTGTHFWGFETQGVLPDIVTMAKGIGNGVPLAAVVTTTKIAATLAQRTHFNTFGGNPVVCAQGKAVLDVIAREKLQENALKIGIKLQLV
jgi:4-aminobutyrate aminotransferase-like enzyme